MDSSIQYRVYSVRVSANVTPLIFVCTETSMSHDREAHSPGGCNELKTVWLFLWLEHQASSGEPFPPEDDFSEISSRGGLERLETETATTRTQAKATGVSLPETDPVATYNKYNFERKYNPQLTITRFRDKVWKMMRFLNARRQ